MVDHRLDAFDPDRKEPRERRLRDTAQVSGPRAVPAEVERELRARAGDRSGGRPARAPLQESHPRLLAMPLPMLLPMVSRVGSGPTA